MYSRRSRDAGSAGTAGSAGIQTVQEVDAVQAVCTSTCPCRHAVYRYKAGSKGYHGKLSGASSAFGEGCTGRKCSQCKHFRKYRECMQHS